MGKRIRCVEADVEHFGMVAFQIVEGLGERDAVACERSGVGMIVGVDL